MPQNSNFRLPRSHRIFAKNGNYCYGAKSRWELPSGPSWGQLGPIWSKKWVKTVKIYHAPKFEFSTTPPSIIDFSQKMEVTVMAPNHGGDTLGSILGSMGSNCVQKMGQNHKKLPSPKSRIFDYPAVIDLKKKNGSYGYGAKSQWWVHLRANGAILGKKNGSKP